MNKQLAVLNRVSVTLVARSEGELPLLSIGDLIRVHRVVFKARQHQFDVFVDGTYDPRVSICIWDPSFLGIQLENDDTNNIHQQIADALNPIWKSQHPTIHIPGIHVEWNNERHYPFTEFDWNRLRCLSSWVYDSLTTYRCLYNQYVIDLSKWIELEMPYRDIIVKVIDIEDSPDPFCQPSSNDVFFSQDSNYNSQCLASSNFVANTGKSSNILGDTKLRLRVTDQSCCNFHQPQFTNSSNPTTDGSQLDDIWILTSFWPSAVPQLRTLKVGNWIRVRNAEYKGPQPLKGQTKFLPPLRREWEFLLIDCFRARIIRIPHCYFSGSLCS